MKEHLGDRRDSYEDVPQIIAHDPDIQRICEQRKREEGILPPRDIDLIEAFLVQRGVERMLLEPSGDTAPDGKSPIDGFWFEVSFNDGCSHSEYMEAFLQLFKVFNVFSLRFGIDFDIPGEPVMAVGYNN